MKKTVQILALLLVSFSSFAESREVAKCGDYVLSQQSSSSYFAGIKHTQDRYRLTDVNGDSELMEISLNSDGATFKSVYVPAGLSITATWSDFELSIDNDEKKEKIKCRKL